MVYVYIIQRHANQGYLPTLEEVQKSAQHLYHLAQTSTVLVMSYFLPKRKYEDTDYNDV